MSEPRCYCTKNTAVVWTHIGRDGEPIDGPRQLRRQCLNCGALGASALSHRLGTPTTPIVDVEAVKRWNLGRTEYYARRSMSFLKERETVKDSVRDQYEAYLQTDAWRAKRAVALKRANGICEGCGTRPATQVHHLSYLHLGDEFLWELKAVCAVCHAKCHPDKQAERGVA